MIVKVNKKKLSNRLIPLLVVLTSVLGMSFLCPPSLPAFEQKVPEKVPLRVPHLVDNTKIHVDGRLDEPFWGEALVMELGYEVRPGENIKPPVRTEVLMAFTDTHFYVGFRAYDPEPSAIRAVYTDRDNFPDHDFVGIILDTFNDKRRTYDFYCNPFGIQADGSQTATDWVEWDAIWDSAGRITDKGYMVEMSIPFSAMRFQRAKGDQVWGIDAIRCYPRNVRHFISIFPWDRNNYCYMCQFEKLIGFEGARPGKNVELDPTLSTVMTQEKEPFLAGDFVDSDRVEPGLTARWGFTPNLTLSAAINPDFSHVEADVAELDINRKFAIYYPEKRPFFMEAADIFKTPFAVFYTRSLADPDWGIKLAGKEGVNALGLYSVQDRMTNILIPGSYSSLSTSIDQEAIGSVLRYRRDIGTMSTLGVLITDREGDDYFNRMAGFDAFFRLDRKKHVSLQFLGSQTRYPGQFAATYGQPEESFTGTALNFVFRHESRDIGYWVSYQQITPEFRADLGFIPQVGFRNVTAQFILASWKNPGHWYTFMNLAPTVEYEVDYNDNLIYKDFKLTYTYAGPWQSSLKLVGILGQRSYLGNVFDTDSINFYTSIQPSGVFQFWLNGSYGDYIDYDNVRPGTRWLLNPGVFIKTGRHFSINLDHAFERFTVEAGRLYTANVSNLQLVYQFSRRAFLRSILQYVDYNYNVDNYLFPLDPRFKHFFTQILFSYKINPQTMLFLGYSDDYYGFSAISLTQNNRTLFLKIGYALVL